MPQEQETNTSGKRDKTFSAPAISLPKGGGALRGIGEKFAANPVTGTGSMTVPIATSPGRSGFGPQLSLSYDSGAGNGSFGFGWSLSLPSITRKTDKGLPKYQNNEESDVFILSGAEDLVPVLIQDGGKWTPEIIPPRTVAGQIYHIQRYRPRIEGLFARIERWTNQTDAKDTFWRSISRENITSWYGKTEESRIADQADLTRIFSWLICESHDDKGNVIVYRYKEENSDGVGLSQAHESNRTDATRSANRYLRRIRYGNHKPYLPMLSAPPPWPSPPGATAPDASLDWFFEVVFDYGEHNTDTPMPEEPGKKWPCRNDPFSSYRAGFEVRTYRLCQRVLMFHHFPTEAGVGANCLVRSTDFTYSYEEEPTSVQNPIFSFLLSVAQSGYKRQQNGDYLKKSLPPLDFQYSKPTISEEVMEADPESLENLPCGLDGKVYQWVDLDGEGLSGILTEQAEGWFYKRNLSPVNVKATNGQERVVAQFGPLETFSEKPSLAALSVGRQQFLDLAGDGQLDLVDFQGPPPGFYERTQDEGWKPFAVFPSLPVLDWNDPNLKFVDLTGDGHADILITEDEVFTWYPSLAEDGFGPAARVHQALDEEKGPKLVFADRTQSIHLSDMSGDGLTDLVRISNGEVCYWPNLGYGRFGTKVTMDTPPWFDDYRFDQKRIRLADIDGSGTTDIIYLKHEGAEIYFNQSGNSWSQPCTLAAFPHFDNSSSVLATDLLGNGTACLVWSSPLHADACRPMRYIDLMGGQKPHLLIRVANNLGAETRLKYAPSTKFYVADKLAGTPWLTRIPFPVHVVERVEQYDYVNRNHFVTRYGYHHGYYDGVEREFRGFGKMEQWDTEEFATLSASGDLLPNLNIDASSHVPRVHTKTWFHTGVSVGREHISNFFAGLPDAPDLGEYYREPGMDGPQAKALLLADTELPEGLTLEEEREACRALKGSMLRQEVYALDGTDKEKHPYTVTEQNLTVRRLQPQGGNRHGVFFTHAREAVNYHYERNQTDPRISHALTLEVDKFGNVLKSGVIGYGRRKDATDALLKAEDHEQQRLIHITCTENSFTDPVVDEADAYRTPLPAETRTYELRQPQQEKSKNEPTKLYSFDALLSFVNQAGDGEHDVNYEDLDFTKAKEAAANNPEDDKKYFRRLIEHALTLYRKNDLTALLELGKLEPLALPGETFKLAFTPGLLTQVYRRPLDVLQLPGAPASQDLLADPASVLAADLPGGQVADRGGYLSSQTLRSQNLFPPNHDDPLWTMSDADDHWWIPSGRVFYHPDAHATAAEERTVASENFFFPRRYRDPFDQSIGVDYDGPSDPQARRYNLLVTCTHDPLGNEMRADNDYRVLQPYLVTDPNGNRSRVAFDLLGLVAGTAVMGKSGETWGDTLSGFEADLAPAQIDGFYEADDPHLPALALLKGATTRIIYDLDRFQRTQQAHPDDPSQWQPVYAATLARETHVSDPLPPDGLKVQISFSYSDGFGREIQKKIQAEPGPLLEGGLAIDQRWVGSGWTIFNNKGKPVRQYEPFFSQLPARRHQFEFGVQVGVSPILFYDPVERVVATLHPNHTYEKVVFDPWRQATYDVNDTVTLDPSADEDVKGFFLHADGKERLPKEDYSPTWYAQRRDGDMGAQEQTAADRAAAHAHTPTVAHFDSLGRPFLTIAHNKFHRTNPDNTIEKVEEKYLTRVYQDIEGNQREVRDAVEQAGDPLGRIVVRYDYDMLGNRIHQAGMEAGERWMLNDVAGKPIRAWDSRGHNFRTAYDPLRRPLRSFVTGADPAQPDQELLTERLVYGEQHPDDKLFNLRGKLYMHFDQAGVVADEAHDFKGNLLRSSRRLAQEYKQVAGWSAINAALPADPTAKLDPGALQAALKPLLEADTFTSRSTYDALNRPVTLRTPDNSVIRHTYNEANLLESVDACLSGAQQNGQPVWTPFVTDIDYNAKGQRTLIDYGNGVRTTYEYDALTFRLTHLYTRRDAVAFADDCPQPPPAGWPGCAVQNLRYTYDPAGNITHIQDDAQQTIYFRNQRVEPTSDYTYDAIYRLIKAEGREHLGQIGEAPIPHSYNDIPRVGVLSTDGVGLFSPNDGKAMGTYVEQYLYDEVGNFKEMKHRGSAPAQAGWTRSYAYNEASLIEPGKKSNRLSSTTVNGTVERYVHDAHGSMTRMPHLANHPDPAAPNLHWDYKDQLRQADLGGGGAAYYVYDAAGQRVRKVWEKPGLTEERLYLGGFEVFRRRNGAGAVTLERQTLHIMDDKRRLALVETRTIDTAGNDQAPARLIRYQFGNHLGSASLELDGNGQIISYEEYYPYGSTSYQAVHSQTDTPKRYRYTGKERDEESGFYYHGARYYASWLGRWVSCDPIGIKSNLALYTYARDNPIRMVDPDGKEDMDVVIQAHTLAGLQGPEAQKRLEEQNATRGEYIKGALKAVGSVAVGTFKLVTGLLGASWQEEAVVETVEGVKNLPQNVKETVRDWEKLPPQEKSYRVTTGALLIYGGYKAGSAGVSRLRGVGAARPTAPRTRGRSALDKPETPQPPEARASKAPAEQPSTAAGPGSFGAEDVALGVTKEGLKEFAGQAKRGTEFDLASRDPQVETLAEGCVREAFESVSKTGGNIRFSLKGFDIKAALDPTSPIFKRTTPGEFRAIMRDPALRARTVFYDASGKAVSGETLFGKLTAQQRSVILDPRYKGPGIGGH
jgi:RHS repeat-associated protein